MRILYSIHPTHTLHIDSLHDRRFGIENEQVKEAVRRFCLLKQINKQTNKKNKFLIFVDHRLQSTSLFPILKQPSFFKIVCQTSFKTNFVVAKN